MENKGVVNETRINVRTLTLTGSAQQHSVKTEERLDI